jgi:dTMP kinase
MIYLSTHNYPGKLIAVCGTDGAGKTTQINLIHEYFLQKGKEIVLTKQPTQESRDLPIFERYIFHPEEREKIDYRALMCVLMGDRLQHIHEVIRPALKAGKVVISDRYIFTMIATMRARDYTDEKWIYDLCEYILNPDRTFLLDVPYEIAESRIRQRREWKDAYVEKRHLMRYQAEFRKLLDETDMIHIDTSDSDPLKAFSDIERQLHSLMSN